MVAGHLDSFNRSLRSKPFNDMMAESRARLSVESWDKLRQDWQRGCSFILENLKLRLGFFEHLPWVILGGCHHQQEVSKSQLGRAKALWDDLPPGSHALQHPLCRQLFAEGSLREELLLYIKSADPLCEYPLLERFLAPLTFVQITERIIEAAHKELGLLTSGRLAVECFTEGRRLRHFADQFPGHAGHADFLALEDKAPTWKRLTVVRKLLYRDTRVQHADVARAQAVHDDAHKSIEKQTKAFRPKDPKLSAELIFSEACTKFLRDRSCENPGQVFSIAEKFFMPLILRPASIHRPVHAPGIVASGHKNEIVISVLSNSGSFLEGFLKDFLLWSKPDSVLLTLPVDADQPLVSEMLNCLTSQSCFESTSAAVRPRGAKLPSTLHVTAGILQQAGFLGHNDSGWYVTRQSVEEMRFKHVLTRPCTLAQLADRPLQELSLCELLVKARQDGWQWQKPSSSKKKQPAELKYEVGGPLVWYATGVTVHREYILCLLDAERLRRDFQIMWVPHCAPCQVYEMLLEGKPVHEALAIANEASRKRKPKSAGMLLDVVLEDERVQHEAVRKPRKKVLALPASASTAEAEPEPVLGSLEAPEADTVEDQTFVQDILDLIDQQEQALDSAGPSASKPLSALVAGAADETDMLGQSETPPVPLEPPPPAADAAEGAVSFDPPAAEAADRPLHGPAAASRVRHDSRPEAWESLVFHRKLPKSAPPYGGLEAVCKFHALNDRTGCKKFVRFAGPTLADEDRTLWILRHWCNCAKQCQRQRHHMRMPLGPEAIPNNEIIAQQRLADDPPQRAPTDEELDGKDAASSAPAAKAKAAEAKAKAKTAPKRKAKAKAKGKSRVDPELEPVPAGGFVVVITVPGLVVL
eukprot:s6775_g5.t1